MRTNFDLAPYRRSTVGYDPVSDLHGYPPFNIARQSEDSYRITLAIPGFRPDEIEVVAQQNQLTVTGKRTEDKDEGEYLHRGIAARPFERRFRLADFVEVKSASCDNGLLRIDLHRVIPEAMKPRKIEISGSGPANDRVEPPKDENRHAA